MCCLLNINYKSGTGLGNGINLGPVKREKAHSNLKRECSI